MESNITPKPKRVLVLVRHGESEWNKIDLWTGFVDIGLSDKGKKEAKEAAGVIHDITFDRAYTSMLSRASDTLAIIQDTLGWNVPVTRDSALNERNYGIYTGKNKFEIKKNVGDEMFLHLRRGWDYPIEGGESLKQVYNRVVPYFEQEILPKLKGGENILISAHGNSLRALIKYLDHVSDEDIAKVELITGEVVVYYLDEEGAVVRKEKRSTETQNQSQASG